MRENRYDIINDVIKKIDLVRLKLLQDPEARLSKVQTLLKLSSNFCCLFTKGVRAGIHVGYLNF